MGLFEVIGGLFVFSFLAMLPVLFIPVALAYVAVRIRDARHARPDPAIGLKSAFHLVHSLAVLMVLAGLSLSASDLMQGQLGGQPRNQPAQPPFVGVGMRPPPAPPPKDEFWNTAQRSAAALVASGVLFGLIFWGMLLTGTNDRKYPIVRRTYVGARLAVCLLVVFTAVTVVGLVLAQKDPKMEPVELLAGVLIVWLPGSAVHGFLFQQAAKRPTEPPEPTPRRPAGGIELDDEDED
jgi:hypothetical protein